MLSLAAMALSACGGGQGSSGGGSKTAAGNGAITARLTGDWTILHPQVTSGQPSSYLIQGLYDRLVTIGPGAKVVPYLAKSWTQTPTSITFQVRTDATWADGAKLTPTAIAGSFQRLVKGPIANQLFGAGPTPSRLMKPPEPSPSTCAQRRHDGCQPAADGRA